MFENNTYYPRYNNNYGYRNYNNYYNPAFTNPYYTNTTIPNMDYTMSKDFNEEVLKDENTKDTIEKEEDSKFRLGPLSVGENRIDLFGFSLAIDDLIIIALIILLFLEHENNFTLLIVLGMMLFNFSFSSLNLF